MKEKKPTVAFLCVHNACRSQMAEALGRVLAGEVFESCSAGTETKPFLNPDAVRLMKARHGIDMAAAQRSKQIADLPPVDIVVTMGCGVSCPTLPCRHREDWGLPDPTGQPDQVFLEVMDEIEAKVRDLKDRLRSGILLNDTR